MPSSEQPRATIPGTLRREEVTPEGLTAASAGTLPALVGFRVTDIGERALSAELDVRPDLLAPNGYLHAATVIALADTACGMACRMTLPDGASGFTTINLSASFLGTARAGTIGTTATLVHGGRRTQVWDAVVTDGQDRTLALFRCTQMVLWPD